MQKRNKAKIYDQIHQSADAMTVTQTIWQREFTHDSGDSLITHKTWKRFSYNYLVWSLKKKKKLG